MLLPMYIIVVCHHVLILIMISSLTSGFCIVVWLRVTDRVTKVIDVFNLHRQILSCLLLLCAMPYSVVVPKLLSTHVNYVPYIIHVFRCRRYGTFELGLIMYV